MDLGDIFPEPFHYLSPTQIEHVREEFDNQLDLIIDGGPCSIGIESTIIDVTFDVPRILRLGAISLEQLKSITPYQIETALSYRLSKKPLLKQVAKQELEYIIDDYLNQHKTLTVFGLSPVKKKYKNLTWVLMPKDASQYAQVLYKYFMRPNSIQRCNFSGICPRLKSCRVQAI